MTICSLCACVLQCVTFQICSSLKWSKLELVCFRNNQIMRVHLQTTLDHYFNATTIHGFQYVQSGNHWIIRLTWVTLLKRKYTMQCYITSKFFLCCFKLLSIFTGLTICGCIIHSAILDWNENPTITSLDSIAAPINDIQFPTITVCNDKLHEVQDNWSFLETILNFFDYDLNMEKDFQFLFRSIKDVDKTFEMNSTYKFGSLLRNFVDLSNFDSFSQSKSWHDTWQWFWSKPLDYCKALKENEKIIHEFFSNISLAIGLDELQKISLYDIPGILSRIRVQYVLQNPKLQSSFYFTRCQNKEDVKFKQECADEWNSFLSKEIKGRN